MSEGIVLGGINGANPLGFLAALGALAVAREAYGVPRLDWAAHGGAWRPRLQGCGQDAEALLGALAQRLEELPLAPFEVEHRLPFPVDTLRGALEAAQGGAVAGDRRTADFLKAFGDEAYPDEGVFQETALRMVRSGDSAGQGLLAYARSIRRPVCLDELHRALFAPWDYADGGSSLRWDPVEDQAYALRADNPSTSRDRTAPRSMRGANALALEALPLFPVFCVGRVAKTTAFHQRGRTRWLSWPVWRGPLELDPVRSLLTLRSLQEATPDHVTRQGWHALGIETVFRAEVVAPNQYYRNFSPAVPV
jgi:hypothetical protein